MLEIFAVEISATPILVSWKVHDDKIGVAEAKILIWFWCLYRNHHTSKTHPPSGSYSMFTGIIFATAISFGLLTYHIGLPSFIVSQSNWKMMKLNSWYKAEGCCTFRRVMIPMKTWLSNTKIGQRQMNFDILNLSKIQSWRGGENWNEETLEILRDVKLCAAGNRLLAMFFKTLVNSNIYNNSLLYFFK